MATNEPILYMILRRNSFNLLKGIELDSKSVELMRAERKAHAENLDHALYILSLRVI